MSRLDKVIHHNETTASMATNLDRLETCVGHNMHLIRNHTKGKCELYKWDMFNNCTNCPMDAKSNFEKLMEDILYE